MHSRDALKSGLAQNITRDVSALAPGTPRIGQASTGTSSTPPSAQATASGVGFRGSPRGMISVPDVSSSIRSSTPAHAWSRIGYTACHPKQ